MARGRKLSLLEAVSMAVGTMIGASIFSIFGVGARIAGTNLPEAFVLSGLFALLVAYSYARLGARIVSNAGPIAFILRGIGDNLVSGALAVLMWLSYVVSIALFAKGFAGYLLPLVHAKASAAGMRTVEVLVVGFFTALNFFGSKAVGRAELYIVLVKLSILGVFIGLGFMTIRPESVVPAVDPRHLKGTLDASVIFFLSYMGFGLVTNASEHMERPERNVPLAIFISIAVVMAVYVGVSLVAVGNLSIAQLVRAGDNALAVAAEPFLGRFGFVLISVGALFSISSALNATLYGGANIAYSLAKDGELPAVFERKVWFKSTEGLYITSGLALAFALLMNLSEIASLTSAVFTVIYIFVLVSHYRLAGEYGGNRAFLVFGTAVLVAVFGALMLYQWQTQRASFYAVLVTFGGALVVEYLLRHVGKGRRLAGDRRREARD